MHIVFDLPPVCFPVSLPVCLSVRLSTSSFVPDTVLGYGILGKALSRRIRHWQIFDLDPITQNDPHRKGIVYYTSYTFRDFHGHDFNNTYFYMKLPRMDDFQDVCSYLHLNDENKLDGVMIYHKTVFSSFTLSILYCPPTTHIYSIIYTKQETYRQKELATSSLTFSFSHPLTYLQGLFTTVRAKKSIIQYMKSTRISK